MSELKTCPFCGSDNMSTEVLNSTVVKCLDCSAEGPISFSVTEAIELWNTRSSNLRTLKVDVSVIDAEPIADLIDIVCSHPRDELPEALQVKLGKWIDERTSGKD